MTETKSRYRVEGMDCASCAMKIDTAARRIDGISDVAVSVAAGTMTVTHDGSPDLKRLERTIGGLGYKVHALPVASRTPDPADAPAAACGHDHDHPDHDHIHHDHDHHNHDHAHHHGHDHSHDDHSHSHSHAAAKPALADAHTSGDGHDHGPVEGPWWKTAKARLALVSGVALLVAYAVAHLFPQIATPVFILSLLVGLVPIARRAFMAARAGTPFSIETLMTIAAVGAVIIHATEEAAMVVFLFLVGELLEGIAATRARASIRSLSDLVPKTAFVEADGQRREVQADALRPGDLLIVRPGDRVAADGTVVEGESGIDEAPVTGESVAVRKGPGAAVFAGTINGDAALKVKVTAGAADNTIARVIRLVEEAQEAKAPTERFIDRFARYYTPCVLAAGAVVAVVPPVLAGVSWPEWIYKGLAILLIGCPCALVISTPAAIAAALSAGAQRGLLLKGGAVLEQFRDIDMVAFDKTGTLTEGKPVVTDVVAVDGPESDVLRLAAALEAGSSHPLAKAVLDRAGEQPLPAVTGNTAIGGKGVSGLIEGRKVFLGSVKAMEAMGEIPIALRSRIAAFNAEGKTVSLLTVDNRLLGLIALRDEPRADAVEAIRALKAEGIDTIMLTGDNHLTAEAIGVTLGMDVRAELMPEDKQRIVRELKAAGHRVAKVGDGINDAPALAAADIGIAMGGGTDVALDTADAAILHGRVGDVARMIRLSRAAMGNIRQNITIALGLKLVFLVTTLAGITGLWPAILADTGATVIVTLNALRLLKPQD